MTPSPVQRPLEEIHKEANRILRTYPNRDKARELIATMPEDYVKEQAVALARQQWRLFKHEQFLNWCEVRP